MARAVITIMSFAIGFTGVWVYLDGDTAPEPLLQPEAVGQEEGDTFPAVVIPGVACDDCDASGPGGGRLAGAASAVR